jgi:hypothetical protein
MNSNILTVSVRLCVVRAHDACCITITDASLERDEVSVFHVLLCDVGSESDSTSLLRISVTTEGEDEDNTITIMNDYDYDYDNDNSDDDAHGVEKGAET